MATNYEVIEAEAQRKFPTRDLVKVTDNGTVYYASKEPFGPNTFANNVAEMQQSYSHPETGKRISFQAPTTRRSILAAARDFEKLVKPEIFDKHWLQAGYLLRTQEGVWVNPLDAQGQPVTDEQTLKQLLTKDAKVNGIYLLDHDVAFAPYDTFKQGRHEARQFAEGGLARGLEHTPERTAPNLEAMASTYHQGVNVWGFDPVKEPVLQVAGLDSGGDWNGGRLCVDGGRVGDSVGCAFGVRQ